MTGLDTSAEAGRPELENCPVRPARSRWSPRHALVTLARTLPPVAVMRRIVSLITAVVAAGSLGFGVWQYWRQGRLQSIAAVFELHARYYEHLGETTEVTAAIKRSLESPSVDPAQLRCRTLARLGLSVDCPDKTPAPDPEAIEAAIERALGGLEASERERLMSALASRADQSRREVRNKNLPPRWDERLSFLEAVVICAELDRCDSETAYALFGPPIIEMLRISCTAQPSEHATLAARHRLLRFVVAQAEPGWVESLLRAIGSPLARPTALGELPDGCIARRRS